MFNSKQKYIVTQANNLIEARHSSTLQEIRLVLAMIAMVEPTDENFKEYQIKVTDFFNLIGVKYKNKYEVMEMTLDKLMKRVIHIPLEDGFLKVHWVSSARYHKGKGIVSVKFDPELKPFLLNLKGHFTKQELQILLSFSSSYSVRIYQLLKKNERVGKIRLELEDFRNILGIEKQKYAAFKDLRKWVIDYAKKEFESKHKETKTHKSDVTFILETERENRKIKYLIFHIAKQAYQGLILSLENVEVSENETIKRLRNYGISKNDATLFFDEQGKEQIERCLDLFEERIKEGSIKKSSAGYLAKMLRDEAGQPSLFEQEQVKQTKQKKDSLKKRKEEQGRIEELKVEFAEFQNEQIERVISKLSASKKEELRAEFEKEGIKSTVELMQYKKSGLRTGLMRACYRRFLKETFLSENERNFVLWAQDKKGLQIERTDGDNLIIIS